MRKIFLTLVTLFVISSCGNRDEKACNCEVQRYERYTVRSTSFENTLIKAYDWRKEGDPRYFGSDCGANGQTYNRGSFGAFLIDSATYGVTEYEEKVTCK